MAHLQLKTSRLTYSTENFNINHYKRRSEKKDSILTLEFDDLRRIQDADLLYVYQELSKACTRSVPENNSKTFMNYIYNGNMSTVSCIILMHALQMLYLGGGCFL